MSGVLQLLAGIGGDRVDIVNATVTDIDPSGTSTAVWRINTNGDIQQTVGDALTVMYQWIVPASRSSAYDVRWLTGVGTPDVSPAAAGSWVNCNVDRIWSTSWSGGTGVEEVTFTVELRNATTLVVVDTATITLHAEIL